MKQYIVDAFTDEIFSGKPAAVCVMENWPPESLMMSIARENSLSETAFIVREPEGYRAGRSSSTTMPPWLPPSPYSRFSTRNPKRSPSAL